MTMRVEEIAIHCSIFVATIIIGVLLFKVLKYLNSKPLGLQIVFDDLTKDTMIILGLTIRGGQDKFFLKVDTSDAQNF